MKTHFKSFALACLLVMLPEAAMAYTLQCVDGLAVDGTEIFIGAFNCDAYGPDQPFSGLNCYFQQILNEVMKRMYCGIQFHLEHLLQIAILMFVLMYALMFSLGLAALTAKELTIRLIKISLIWAFAMNASYGIGMAFYFLMGGIEEVVTWVIQVFFGPITGLGFIGYIDFLIFEQLTGGFTTQGAMLLGFFGTLAVLMFPVFLLFLVYMMTVMAALTRTVVTYLVGLSAIAFLISLGPIFVSLALFKPTFTFFDSWLRYLISFSLQIILTFAAVALWLYIMSLMGNFFIVLMDMIIPYTDKSHSEASFAFFENTYAICPNGGNSGGFTFGPDGPICAGGEASWPPSRYATEESFIAWITINLISLGTLVYAFDALLRLMPNFARQLSGPAFAPQLGGGAGFGAVSMPGFSSVGRLKQKLMFHAKSGILSSIAGRQSMGERYLASRNSGGGAPSAPGRRSPVRDFTDRARNPTPRS